MGIWQKIFDVRMAWKQKKWKKGAAKKPWTFLLPEEEPSRPGVPDNPCIPYLRKVIEELLERRGQTYREFYPVICDFEEDEVKRLFAVSEVESGFAAYEAEREILRLRRQQDNMLRQLVPGLNRMMLRTNRPAYFEEFVQTMYEENGLMIQLEEKSDLPFPKNCFVIDLELWGQPIQGLFREDIFYLPIYRKTWEIAQNLDISVPIGYNTVIVKGVAADRMPETIDKFEQAFYLGND